jgi:tetratricopeptide (TPR) repeat protein
MTYAAPVPDPTMERIAEGMALGQRGERPAARELLATIWSELEKPDADPLHRVALAHAMADVQDDVHDELEWDLRALAAVEDVTDERARQAGVQSPAAAFYPSLHLNLGDCYRRLGDPTRAREHLERARAALDALPDDGYGRMIRAGLERLAERLSTPD